MFDVVAAVSAYPLNQAVALLPTSAALLPFLEYKAAEAFLVLDEAPAAVTHL